jgi:hypothetical protein
MYSCKWRGSIYWLFTVDGRILGYSLIVKTPRSVTKSRRFCQLTAQRWIHRSAPRNYVYVGRRMRVCVCGSLIAVPPRQLLRHLGLACILCCRLSIGGADELTVGACWYKYCNHLKRCIYGEDHAEPHVEDICLSANGLWLLEFRALKSRIGNFRDLLWYHCQSQWLRGFWTLELQVLSLLV